jgi:hypothetical protein
MLLSYWGSMSAPHLDTVSETLFLHYDDGDARLGWMRHFARWELFSRAQWTIHARLGT